MLSFSEIRHLEGIKGNFEVSDEKEYVAVATLKKAQPIPQLIFSNVPEIVEQQQFVFDSFWERAIPAEQIIKEIEKGIVHPVTIVFSDYKDAEKKEVEMIRKATKEIQILYSTSNAFYLQEKSGTLQLLKEMAEQNNNLSINILLPIDSSIKKSLSFNLLNKNLKNNNIVSQDIAPSINIKIKSLVVDRKESLIMELKHLREEKHTASIGFSIYSNSQSIVLSYASIFEVLYNQSILFEQMKEEDKIKSEFINIAAHELRTPIMPILNGMEILEEKLGDRKIEYKKEIDIITRNASRLHNLAESILQVSRIESGKFRLNIQKNVDIHSLIIQVIEDIEKKYMYTHKAKKVSIVFMPHYEREERGQKKRKDGENTIKHRISDAMINDKDDENNMTYSPLYVNCDPQKISQVIFNLLDNAMRFTEKGQIFVSTTFQRNGRKEEKEERHSSYRNISNISEDKEGNKEDEEIQNNRGINKVNKNNNLVITVQDTGVGLSNKIKDQLFEKFATKSTQGTGLGLYLSKKIVEDHGGKIWYEKPNELAVTSHRKSDWNSSNDDNMRKQIGSIFRFSLPNFIDDKKCV